MSASHRSLARLPNSIFTNLKFRQKDDNDIRTGTGSYSYEDQDLYQSSASNLKEAICTKLKDAGGSSSSGNFVGNVISNHHSGGIGSITTVGQIMRLTPPTLLGLLDPLLTNGKLKFIHWLNFSSFLYHKSLFE
jgi:hypothetical protein